jgi:hypothetical protein
VGESIDQGFYPSSFCILFCSQHFLDVPWEYFAASRKGFRQKKGFVQSLIFQRRLNSNRKLHQLDLMLYFQNP